MYPSLYGSGAVGNDPYGFYNTPAPSRPQAVPQQKKLDKVNGRNGAEMYWMAPDSEVLLPDTQDPIVWFIKTDSAGYKTIIPYDIKQHEDEPAPNMKDIDSKLESFDERLKKIEEVLA